MTRRQWLNLGLTQAAAAVYGCEASPKSVQAAPEAPETTTPDREPPPQTESAPEANAAPTPRRQIALQLLGPEIADAHVELVRVALDTFYDFDVTVLERIPLPRSAYYAPRQRYRAERLLPTLQPRIPEGGERILALTSVDISTTKGTIKDWGILGLATIDGRACIISSFRTKRKAKNAEHAAQRFAKTAVHEIGHTLGLDHCPNRGCLMEDGKGSVFTTDGEYDLCARCRRLLTARGVPLVDPAAVVIPWPRPAADPL